MTKLPRDVKGREMIAILTKLGFEKVGGKGSHIRLKHHDGRVTQVAVHPKPIPHGTLRAILRQIEVNVEDLIKLR